MKKFLCLCILCFQSFYVLSQVAIEENFNEEQWSVEAVATNSKVMWSHHESDGFEGSGAAIAEVNNTDTFFGNAILHFNDIDLSGIENPIFKVRWAWAVISGVSPVWAFRDSESTELIFPIGGFFVVDAPLNLSTAELEDWVPDDDDFFVIDFDLSSHISLTDFQFEISAQQGKVVAYIDYVYMGSGEPGGGNDMSLDLEAAAEKIVLYPNPSFEEDIQLYLPALWSRELLLLELLTIDGKVIKQEEVQGEHILCETSVLKSGIYFIKLQHPSGGVYVKKIQIQ